MRTLYIRTDGNESIGLGHVVRCVALAEMVSSLFHTTFVVKNSSDVATDIIRNQAFAIQTIENENDFFNKLSAESTVVTDGYNFDTAYFNAIVATGVKLICIDDMMNQYYPAHLIINQNPACKPSDYHAAPYTQFAIGLEYALLRKPFREAATGQQKALKNGKYLIAMGGVDPFDISKKCIDTLLGQVEPGRVTLLISASKNKRYHSEYPMIKTVHSLSAEEMCRLMLQHQFLICPASSVSIEGLCLGMELICGYYAENQKNFYSYLADSGIIHKVGDYNTNFEKQFILAMNEGELKGRINLEIGNNTWLRYSTLFNEI